MKYKLGQCIDCKDGQIKGIIARRCWYHYKIFRIKVNFEKKQAKMSEIGLDSVAEGIKIRDWYRERVKEMSGFCMECGSPLNTEVFEYAICSVAHILPKRPSMFPSVKLHPENWIELGATCGCHYKYDNMGWDTIQKMRVWNAIVERFKRFCHEIPMSERRKLPESLLSIIKLTKKNESQGKKADKGSTVRGV